MTTTLPAAEQICGHLSEALSNLAAIPSVKNFDLIKVAEAADFIAAQAAEIERLTKELKDADKEWENNESEAIQLEADLIEIQARAEAAEASLAAVKAERDAVKKIIDFWFAPWGAWKTEAWEDMSGDQPYSPDAALELIRAALSLDAQVKP